MTRNRVLAITVTRGRRELAERCLPTLRANAGCAYDHVVVDNGSQDGTPEWAESFGATVVRLPCNVGRSMAISIGMRVGFAAFRIGPSLDPFMAGVKPHDYVMTVDDDNVFTTPNVVSTLVSVADAAGHLAMVSPLNATLAQHHPEYMPARLSGVSSIAGHPVRPSTHAGGCNMWPWATLQRAENLVSDLSKCNWLRSMDPDFRAYYVLDVAYEHAGQGQAVGSQENSTYLL